MKNLIFLLILFFGFNISAQDLSSEEIEIIDLTYAFSNETIYWVTAREFNLEEVAKGKTEKGFYYSANNFSTAEHGGTHIDAPIHFAENKQSVDEIPLDQLIGTGIKIDVSKMARQNPDYRIRIEDLKQWEQTNGIIPEKSIVLFETGFGKFYPNAKKYLGTDKRGPEAVKELHFPGLSKEAAEWLIANRNIKAVGLDTASIDYGQSTNFDTHVMLMTHNIPAFENVAHLEKLPATGFQIIALPIKIKGGSGGPLRIIAIK
ncbi:cyclase family protein [Gramella sp. MAR_2010_147]|uniref:cyclase family protein n=1 Tax=Gramella sp. MAR_2010_147 TaxID=1250205 RepID=UPI00087A3FF6|nr:cyclase family protein [Gramella sp. MAR_2010_147]SDR96785.1 Kynurenine formamidase [Gramella sp. MAR_2010_147]